MLLKYAPPIEKVVCISGFPPGGRAPSNSSFYTQFGPFGKIQSIHHSVSPTRHYIFIIFDTGETARAAALIRNYRWHIQPLAAAPEEILSAFRRLIHHRSPDRRQVSPPSRARSIDSRWVEHEKRNPPARTKPDEGWRSHRAASPSYPRRSRSPPLRPPIDHVYDAPPPNHPPRSPLRRPSQNLGYRSPYNDGRYFSSPPSRLERLPPDEMERPIRREEYDDRYLHEYSRAPSAANFTPSAYRAAGSFPYSRQETSWPDRRRSHDALGVTLDSEVQAKRPRHMDDILDSRDHWNEPVRSRRDSSLSYHPIDHRAPPNQFSSSVSASRDIAPYPHSSRTPFRDDQYEYRKEFPRDVPAAPRAEMNVRRADYGPGYYGEERDPYGDRDIGDRFRGLRQHSSYDVLPSPPSGAHSGSYERSNHLRRSPSRPRHDIISPPLPPRQESSYSIQEDARGSTSKSTPNFTPTRDERVPSSVEVFHDNDSRRASYTVTRERSPDAPPAFETRPRHDRASFGEGSTSGYQRASTQDEPSGPSHSRKYEDRSEKVVVPAYAARHDDRHIGPHRDRDPPSVVTVFVSGLPQLVFASKLRDFFSAIGSENLIGLDTGRAGFAFVRVANMDAAELAVKELHHKRYENHVINVSIGKPPAEYRRHKYDTRVKLKTELKATKKNAKLARLEKQSKSVQKQNEGTLHAEGLKKDQSGQVHAGSTLLGRIGAREEDEDQSQASRTPSAGTEMSDRLSLPILDSTMDGFDSQATTDATVPDPLLGEENTEADFHANISTDEDSDDEQSPDTKSSFIADQHFIDSFLEDAKQYAYSKMGDIIDSRPEEDTGIPGLSISKGYSTQPSNSRPPHMHPSSGQSPPAQRLVPRDTYNLRAADGPSQGRSFSTMHEGGNVMATGFPRPKDHSPSASKRGNDHELDDLENQLAGR